MSHVTETEFRWDDDMLSKLSAAQSLQNVCIRFESHISGTLMNPYKSI